MATRILKHSPWMDGFLFIGNQLALDFLNTRPQIDGERKELLPDFHAVVRWFRAAGLLDSPTAARLRRAWGESARARRVVKAFWILREQLRKAVLAWESADTLPQKTVEMLNRLVTEHPMLVRLKPGDSGFVTELWFRPDAPEDLFAPIAHSAARLFTEAERNRVRMCGNCVLHFLDASKKGTRRWCSMQLCGNRLKVSAYAQRKRKSALVGVPEARR